MNRHTGDTTEHAATERRSAARALLLNPILTTARHPDQLILVRRHSAALKQLFATTLGYPLVIESTFARLLKAPPSTDTMSRPALRSNGDPFAPRTYTYLALLCAGLLSPQVAEQVLLSQLVGQVRTDAVTAGVAVDDTLADRRHLVRALALLVEWGVLTETDGSVAGWEHRQDEALLDVHRGLLPHLLSRSLADVSKDEALVDLAVADQPRRSLRRKLVENPVVRRADLTAAEADVLSRERRELTRVLDEAFGLTVEVRAEGALAFDPDEVLSDIAFPGIGTVPHAALLLINALADCLDASAGTTAWIDGREVPGALAPWPMVGENIELLVEQYGSAFARAYTADSAVLQDDVVRLLESLGLVRSTDGGLLLDPCSARYRPEPHRLPAKSESRVQAEPTPLDLFDDLEAAP